MEQEEIQRTLKALKCCGSFEDTCCRECPYKELGFSECTQKLAAGALTYIKYLGGLEV